MKEKIIHTAIELFLDHGFKSVTMDTIAKQIGISKKTIYVHFETKTKLVEACVSIVFKNACQWIDDICQNSHNSIEELYDIKKYVMHLLKNDQASPQNQLKKYYPQIFRILQKKKFEVMKVSMTESIRKGVEAGLFRADIDVDFTYRMYFNGMMGIKDGVLFPSEDFDMEYLIGSYLEYHLRAICSDKGLQVLMKFIKNQV